MDFGPSLTLFNSKIDQQRYQNLDRFLDGLRMVPLRLRIQTFSPNTVVQLSEGLGLWNRGLVLGILHAVCRWHGEFLPRYLKYLSMYNCISHM